MNADEKVVTPHHLELSSTADDPDLVRRAQQADQADHNLGIKEALKRYPRAVAWSMFLSLALGFDLSIIGSFFGQTQFKQRFGDIGEGANKAISAKWQSGLANSSVCGQIIGLAINAYTQDRFGNRHTMLFFLTWIIAAIFIPVFAPNLAVLAFGQVMCGIAWGTFQTLTTAYASEVVPTVLRPFVTAYVCMCWGAGITISAAVLRGVTGIQSQWGWRLPFMLQWIWPVPLMIGVYFAPESPWNSVRRGKNDLALSALRRLGSKDETEEDFRAKLALIVHTTELERLETQGATILECFKGTNWRRTEINMVIWAAQILSGNAILGYAVVFLEKAGFSEVQAFDVNISLSVCYLVGGVISWFLMVRMGRATIYMSCLAFMLMCLFVIGGLGCVKNPGDGVMMSIGIVMVIQTLANMIGVGPTIVIGRIIYNCTGIFSNSLTPHMIQEWGWGAKTAFFYAGTNVLCLIWCWFRLPETKDRTFGEIDIMFENHVPARKFKHTNVDQFASLHPDNRSISDKKDVDEHAEYA